MLNKRSGSSPSSRRQVCEIPGAGWRDSWNDKIVEEIIDGFLLRSVEHRAEGLRCFVFKRHDSICDAIAFSETAQLLRGLRFAPDSKVLGKVKLEAKQIDLPQFEHPNRHEHARTCGCILNRG